MHVTTLMSRLSFVVTLFVALLMTAGIGRAAPMIVAGGGEGVTTDLFDVAQGAKVVGAISTPSPIFEYERALGATIAGGETKHSIFSDSGGPTQQFTFRTPAPIDLSSYNLILQQDGASSNRSAVAARVFASNDGINFTKISDSADTTASLSNYQTNFGAPAITVSDSVNTTAQFFRVETDSATTRGPRVIEFDAIATAVPIIVDPVLFNAASNSGGDEPPGLSVSFNVSSRVGGIDDPEGAFGNNDGPIEGSTFIFDNPGTNDNGNGILGDGGETVDFIEWHTAQPIDIVGYRIDLGGDGLDAPTRGTELVAFYVEGVQVDLFDNNHLSGAVSRLFSVGKVYGDDFRIEFTRTQGSPRIREIDAIVGTVPEPASMTLLALGGMAMLRRRKAR